MNSVITKDAANTTLPFEQQPKESNKAFAAFREYLDLGPERSMAAVAKKLSKSEQLIRRWGFKYDWTARVKAHGAHLAERERLAIESLATEKAVEWVKTHDATKREAWREAQETIVMIRKARAEWMEKGRLPGWEGMARMLELAFKLKQFAAGLPSETTAVTGADGGPVQVEISLALEKIYGAAKAEVVDVEAKPGNSQLQIADGKGGQR